MYQPDLSPYSYVDASSQVFAIGWLDRGHPFTRAAVPLMGLARDLEHALERGTVHQMRGYHYCPFCSDEAPLAPGKRFPLGSAEIWVPAADGRVYAAPDLVHHYVTKHAYAPPTEFIQALSALDFESWDPEQTFEANIGRRL